MVLFLHFIPSIPSISHGEFHGLFISPLNPQNTLSAMASPATAPMSKVWNFGLLKQLPEVVNIQCLHVLTAVCWYCCIGISILMYIAPCYRSGAMHIHVMAATRECHGHAGPQGHSQGAAEKAVSDRWLVQLGVDSHCIATSILAEPPTEKETTSKNLPTNPPNKRSCLGISSISAGNIKNQESCG